MITQVQILQEEQIFASLQQNGSANFEVPQRNAATFQAGRNLRFIHANQEMVLTVKSQRFTHQPHDDRKVVLVEVTKCAN